MLKLVTLGANDIGIQKLDPAWTTPKGRWKKLYGEVSVRGEEYRIQSCLTFIEGVSASMGGKTEFGVTLEPEPTNPEDPMAVKVVGFWTEKAGWFSKRRHTAHLGYVPRNMAFALSKRVDEGRSLGACLRSIQVGSDELNIVIDVLAS